MRIVRPVPASVLRERERKATMASHQSDEAQYIAAARGTQTCDAATVTAFINAGPNWWLDERQAWLDAQIAADTARGGSAFG